MLKAREAGRETLIRIRETRERSEPEICGIIRSAGKPPDRKTKEEKGMAENENRSGSILRITDAVEGLTRRKDASICGQIRTGIVPLDEALGGGLIEGLIVLGGVPAAGKTSFALQMAEGISEQGERDALIASLEMSAAELAAKGLSRCMRDAEPLTGVPAMTAMELLTGGGGGTEGAAMTATFGKLYAERAKRVYVYEGAWDRPTRMEDVERAVEEHAAAHKSAPVVVVDYLQMLAPPEPGLGDKQCVDRNVYLLKAMAKKHHVPVIALSSFSRAGYASAASMSSYKESGGIEYASDVLLALIPAGRAGEEAPLPDGAVQVELACLKQKHMPPFRLALSFEPRYSRYAAMRPAEHAEKVREPVRTVL